MSPPKTVIDTKRVQALLRYCEAIFRGAGRPIVFPKGTDPTKTYNWRYLEAFLRRCDEWEIQDRTAYKIIHAVVDRCRKDGTLKRKGLSILTCKGILEVGYKWLLAYESRVKMVLARLSQEHKFLAENARDYTTLLNRETPNALPNLVKWFHQRKISTEMLVTSAVCQAAFHKLERRDRNQLPDFIELARARNFCADLDVFPRLKSIIGEDLLVIGSR